MYVFPIPNGFRDRAISLYSPKIVDKKAILRTVSNTGIYCSSDKVRTLYLVHYLFQNSTVNNNTLRTRVRTWRVPRLYSVLYNETVLSRKPNRTHVHIYTCLLRMTDTMTTENMDLSSWDILYINVTFTSYAAAYAWSMFRHGKWLLNNTAHAGVTSLWSKHAHWDPKDFT
jgi:hypothetical protein